MPCQCFSNGIQPRGSGLERGSSQAPSQPMAALVHNRCSPRQQQIGNPNAAQLQAHHQTTASTYGSMSKYNRSVSQSMATPSTHAHHVFGNNGKKPGALPPKISSYHGKSAALPATPTAQYTAGQRPLSASAATGDNCRAGNYFGHASSANMLYAGGRHSSRHVHATTYRGTVTMGSCLSNNRLRNSLDSATNDCYSTAGGNNGANLLLPSSEVEHGFGNSVRGQHAHHSHPMRSSCDGCNLVRHGSSTAAIHTLLNGKLRKMLLNEPANKDLSGNAHNYRDHRASFDFSVSTPKGNCFPELPSRMSRTDSSILLPQSFLGSQPLTLPPDSFDDVYNYSMDTEGPLELTDNYRPISPPAEYAEEIRPSQNEAHPRYQYQRSYSHSNEVPLESNKCATNPSTVPYNINSHKSLPDLHAQTSRHSPHSEILSCCSRGNRSIKSTGESSLNRDSGGSSGHYTHRSEPCFKQREAEREAEREAYENKVIYAANVCKPTNDFRRDSGSSTQHSTNSFCDFVSSTYRNADCSDCRCKSGVASGGSGAQNPVDYPEYMYNFSTPVVPEAFQDDYSPPPSPSAARYKKQLEERRYSNTPSPRQLHNPHAYQPARATKHSSQSPVLPSPGSAPSLEDLSPPPIQFKRQKCIRFKSRHRVIMANSQAGDSGRNVAESYHQPISDRPKFKFRKSPTPEESYRRGELTPGSRRNSQQLSDRSVTPPPPMRLSESVPNFERFFDLLGLNDDKFNEIYSARRRHSRDGDSDCSSTVFFSDVSTVDSMRLPDSTETQPQTTQAYRSTEQPSIVERNARIIKWLCHCRKMQYT